MSLETVFIIGFWVGAILAFLGIISNPNLRDGCLKPTAMILIVFILVVAFNLINYWVKITEYPNINLLINCGLSVLCTSPVLLPLILAYLKLKDLDSESEKKEVAIVFFGSSFGLGVISVIVVIAIKFFIELIVSIFHWLFAK